MEYKLDFEDIRFNLIDFLHMGKLSELKRFEGQNEELYVSILEEAAKFAKNEIGPLNERSDREGLKVEQGRVHMPQGFKEVWTKFCENGLNGIDINQEYGGLGLPTALQITAMEFIVGACASFCFFNLLTRGDCALIQEFGTEEQKQLYIPRMVSGQWTGTMCLTEPQAGSAVGDLTTTARKNADGSYSLRGTKIFITCGNHDMTENNIHLVLARIEGDAPGTKGISLFIVPEKRVHPDGSLGVDNDVKLISIEHKMGIKASPTCLLQFGDEDQCQGELIGQASQGMIYMFHLMNEARLNVGVQGVATAAAAYEYALNYAKERVQGNKQLIIQYPDVRRMLMTMKAYVEGMRALAMETGVIVDIAWHHGDEAKREEYEGYAGILTPVCKAFGSDMGFRVTELAIQTYGGYGYVQDYPVEQYMRDLKIASLYEGTNGIQAMDLIGRKFLRNQGKDMSRFLKRLQQQLGAALEHAELKRYAQKVVAQIQRYEQAAQFIAERAPQQADYIGLSATPFLRALGDILCAQVLIRRAVVASEQLANAQGERQKFLQGKLEVAKFYVEQLLPEAELNLARIFSEDVSALADVL